jgi:predicted MFS family arabinose efflux permease
MMNNSNSNKTDAMSDAGFALIFFGIGEILGCFAIGWFVDHMGSYKACYVNLGIMTVMGFFTVLYAIIFKFNALAYLMCFLWGFQDSAVNTHT